MDTTSGIAPRLQDTLAPLLRGPLPVAVTAWDGSRAGPSDGPAVHLRSPDALRRLLWSPGELGAAQAYVTGELEIEGDVGALLDRVREDFAGRGLTGFPTREAIRSLPALVSQAKDLGLLSAPPQPPASQARLRGRVHTLRRDRSAISHHYDLSNDFYALLLEETMAYSCAWFGEGDDLDPGRPLVDAQRAKLDLICRALQLQEGDTLLDVGCGWGSLSLHAAEHYGARVTGVTIAAEQKAYIDEQIAQRGLTDRVSIELRDYREVTGEFDAVGSIEMGEHVGQANYPTYVEALRSRVRPGGHVLIQQMSRRGKAPGGGPFIEAFIAPDMHMRPLGETVEFFESGGLEVRHVRTMREHYVWTVDAWLATFEEHLDELTELVGEEVVRVWRLYLVGGRQAFRDARMGVHQILSRRPEETR
ncbi:SAM-dependent methyltransferase [Janibacter cremeus]|uniref:Cyclopropane-fatty-acyl-phospholipid synthase n=1 Tax=Janibacter cremeus TaxID=1285192 RepID=A0A852VRI5_9MICO|nr:cyclopropane-fatty-acyl-phospholipid synthase family protein [Janibacter cremeus]NYF96944.1 cyclopropane-fatty-acyl-phospholipid synthase [Janibacter cremeus]